MTKSDTLLVDNSGVVQNQPFILLPDTLPFPAFVVTADGPAYYNEAFVTYVGFRPGSSYADRTALHHPDEQPILEAARNAGAKADVDYVVEARLRRSDGEYRWHRIHNKPLFECGRRVAYLGTTIDIHDPRLLNDLLEARVRERTSELEKANRSLIEGEARYRALYNRTPVALHSCDGNRRIVEVNDTWLGLFSYGRAEVIGKSVDNYMTSCSASIYKDKAWPEMLSSDGQIRVVDYDFVTKLDFGRSRGVAGCADQGVDRGLGDLNGLGRGRRCAEIMVGPEFAADKGKRVAKGR
jgi:PAS domain S-box-containing protein